MNMSELAQPVGVRTVLYLSPAVCAAALSAAQQSGLSLQEWLDHRVSSAMSGDDVMLSDSLDTLAPWSLACADLFCQVVNHAPEALHARWQLLHERVRLDRSLWIESVETLQEIEAGNLPTGPYLSIRKLRAAWPRLCAATFCV
jgi:hypothetical protein